MAINQWTNMTGSGTVAADGPQPTSRFYYSRIAPLNRTMTQGPLKGSWASSTIFAGASFVGWHATTRLVPASEKDDAGGIYQFGAANNRPPFSAWLNRFCTDPLAAQTISGTFDLIDGVNTKRGDPVLSPQDDGDVRLQVYIYVTVGDDVSQVRGVLLDYIDTVKLPANITMTRLAAPQALTPVTCQAGDRVVIERGFRFVSMPDPVPTYPVSTFNFVNNVYWGTKSGLGAGSQPDAVAGDVGASVRTDKATWCEFSPGLVPGTPDYPGPDTSLIRFGTNDPGTFNNPIEISVPYKTPNPGWDTSRSDVPGEFGLFAEPSGTPGEKSGNAIYFKFTATETNYVFVTCRGTYYPVSLQGFYDPVTGPFGLKPEGKLSIALGHSRKDPGDLEFQGTREYFYLGRSGSSTAFWVEAGETYWLCFANQPMNAFASGGPNGSDKDTKLMGGFNGGLLKFQVYYQDHVPQQNDLYMLNGCLDVIREDPDSGEPTLVMIGDNIVSAFIPTSIEIDYTKKPLYSFGTGSEFEVADGNPFGWLHSGERVVFSDFSLGFSEIIPIDTLSWMPNTAEVDFIEISDGIPGVFGTRGAPSYLHIRRDDGVLYQGYFGSGFRLANGFYSGGGDPAAILDSKSLNPEEGTVYYRDITMAASQLGNPWPDGTGLGVNAGVVTGPFPELGTTAMCFITIDEAKNILYYCSSGFYTSYANNTDVRADDPYVYQWDLTNNVQLPKLGPFTLFGDPATEVTGTPPTAGLRGLKFVPKDSTLLVVNSDRVMRINTNGDVLQWYIPVHPDGLEGYNQTMTDVVLTAEQDFFWAKDGASSAIYKFNLETGEQVNFWDPETIQGTTTQMTIYLPGGFVPPLAGRTIPIRRLRQTPHVLDEHMRFFHQMYELHLETGIGLTEGQGVDPEIMLSWSDDGGHTWSNEHWRKAGKLGEDLIRARWFRLGQSRDRIYRIVVTDPVKWALLDAYLDIEPGTN